MLKHDPKMIDITAIVESTEQPALIVLPPVYWLTATFSDIQKEYVNADSDSYKKNCIERLTWLQNLVDSTKKLSKRERTYRHINRSCDAITLNIHSLVRDIGLGLDIYGRAANYITLFSVDDIVSSLDAQLSAHRLLSVSLQYLDKKASNQKRKLDRLKSSISALNSATKHDQSTIKHLSGEIAEVNSTITRQNVELSRLWVELFNADIAFRDAVAAQGKCDFAKIAKFAALVTTIYMTGGAAVALIGGVAKAYSGIESLNAAATNQNNFSLKDMTTSYHAIIHTVRPVKGDYKDFRKAFNSMSAALNSANQNAPPAPDVPPLPSDYAKIIASKESFDKEIEPYLALPAARHYRDLVDVFVATAEARNNKIVEHDAKISAIQRVNAALVQRAIGVEKVARYTETEVSFDIEEHRYFIKSQVDAVGNEILREITNLKKAIRYVTSRDIDIYISGFSTTDFTATVERVRKEYRQAREYFGQPPTKAQHLPVPFSDLVSGKRYKELVSGGTALVSVPSIGPKDPFKYWFAVQTVGFSIEKIGGGPITGPFGIQIESLGRSLVYDRDRKPHVYSHTAGIIAFYQVNEANEIMTSGTFLDDEQKWFGVSPYGPWRVRLIDTGPEKAAEILEGAITFRIVGRPAQF